MIIIEEIAPLTSRPVNSITAIEHHGGYFQTEMSTKKRSLYGSYLVRDITLPLLSSSSPYTGRDSAFFTCAKRFLREREIKEVQYMKLFNNETRKVNS